MSYPNERTTLEQLETSYGLEPSPSWGTGAKLDRLIRIVAAMDDYLTRLNEPEPTKPARDDSNPGYGPQAK